MKLTTNNKKERSKRTLLEEEIDLSNLLNILGLIFSLCI